MPNANTPKLCRHRTVQQGYVTLNGRQHYLGPWPASRGKKPPPEVQNRYDDLIANWLTNSRQLPNERPPLSVNEMLLAYLMWARQRYVPKRKKDDQYRFIGSAASIVRELFGRTLAAEFGPKKSKLVRHGDGRTRRQGIRPRYGARPGRWCPVRPLRPVSSVAAWDQAPSSAGAEEDPSQARRLVRSVTAATPTHTPNS